jgi:hypothetical protein
LEMPITWRRTFFSRFIFWKLYVKICIFIEFLDIEVLIMWPSHDGFFEAFYKS